MAERNEEHNRERGGWTSRTPGVAVGAPAGQVVPAATPLVTPRRPNLVLVICDTLRRDHIGVYQRLDDGRSLAEWAVHTPSLDAFAAQAALFTQAYPDCLPTIPVRRALHTGRRTWPVRTWTPQRGDTVRAYGWQRIPEAQITLAEVLQEQGYRTGFYTDCFHQFKPSMNFHRGFHQWGWIRGQEKDPYASPFVVRESDVLAVQPPLAQDRPGVNALIRQYLANASERRSEEDHLAPQVFRAGMKWLEENNTRVTGQPFFLCLDSFSPHEPWDPPRYYTDRYDPDYVPGISGREIIAPRYGPAGYLSPAELRHMRALYAGAVTMVDTWFGRFLQKLRAVGEWDNTCVVFISDHGHQLGEHGLTGKVTHGLYPELVDIPLLIKHPRGEGGGRRVDTFVYNHDVLGTALALLGIEPPAHVDSRNVWPFGGGGQVTRGYGITGFNYDVMLRTERWGYIGRADGSSARLYDLRADPAWRRDVAAEQPGTVKELRELVARDAGETPPNLDDARERIATEWYRQA